MTLLTAEPHPSTQHWTRLQALEKLKSSLDNLTVSKEKSIKLSVETQIDDIETFQGFNCVVVGMDTSKQHKDLSKKLEKQKVPYVEPLGSIKYEA